MALLLMSRFRKPRCSGLTLRLVALGLATLRAIPRPLKPGPAGKARLETHAIRIVEALRR